MSQIKKQGYLTKHTGGLHSNSWKKQWVELFGDGTFRWFENQGDKKPKHSINLSNVAAFIAFGDVIHRLPKKPETPGGSVDKLIAIPHEAHTKTEITFFLAPSDDEFKSWTEAIISTLPPPPNQNQPPGQPANRDQVNPVQQGSQQAPPPPPPQQYGAAGYPSQPPGGYPPPGGSAPYPRGAPPPYTPQQPPMGAGPGIGFNVGMPNYNPGGQYPGQYPPPGQHQAYPTAYPQAYPTGPTAYPQGGGYPQPPGYQGYPQPPGYHGYPQQAGYPQQPPGMYGYQQPQIIKVKKKKGKGYKNAAVGLAAGAAGAYMVSRMGGGMMHPFGWGMGHGWGSWSSLSSFGSCGSFGSFGSFD